MPETTTSRPVYRPSGKVRWGRFFQLSLLTLFIAAILAVALDLLYASGHYLIMLAPLVAALPVAGVLGAAVYFGHCRSPLTGALLGFLASVLLYGGMFQAGIAREFGWDSVWRVDLLPAYVNYRLHTDVQQDVGHGSYRKDERPPVGMNVFMFVLESGIVLTMLVIAGTQRSRRAYCEACGRWKSRDVVFYDAGNGGAWRDAINGAGTIASVMGMLKPIDIGVKQRSYTAVAVEYCRAEAGAQDEPQCPVYLGVKNVRSGGGYSRFQQYDAAWGRRLVRQAELTPAEVDAMGAVIPALRRTGHVPGGEVLLEEIGPAIPHPAAAIALATIEPVKSRFGMPEVLSKPAIVMCNVITLMVLVVLFGCIGIGVWGLYFLDQHRWDAGVTLVAIGAIGTAISGFIGLRNPSLMSNRYLRARLNARLAMRPDRIITLVQADQSDFVEIVPRANWGKAMLETATDVGLLRIDERKREVHFEGDRERYRIPLAAIVDCHTEAAVTPGSPVPYHMLVLNVRTREGVREIPIAPRAFGIHKGKDWRQRWTERTRDRIDSLKAGAPG
jgi:hypothetical protein